MNEIIRDEIDVTQRLFKEVICLIEGNEEIIKALNNELKQIEAEQDDLLHEVELAKLNAFEKQKVFDKLKDVRAKRRKIKNDIEQMELIQIFTRKYNNKMIQGDLIQTLKGLSTINKRQAEPKYICRTNILEKLEKRN